MSMHRVVIFRPRIPLSSSFLAPHLAGLLFAGVLGAVDPIAAAGDRPDDEANRLGRFASQVEGLDEARAIAVRPDGEVVTLDSFGGISDDPGSSGFRDLAIDSKDRWFLIDDETVQCRPGGSEIVWNVGPGGLAVDVSGASVWSLDDEGGLRRRDSTTGESLAYRPAAYPGARAIVALPDGGAWVADTDRHRLVRIDAQSDEVRVIGDRGAFPGLFNTPVDLAVNGDQLFVADKLNHRISVHRLADAAFLYQWGMHAVIPREGEGRIHYPNGVAIAPGGDQAFVLEAFERRYQVFDQVSDGESPTGSVLPQTKGVQSHFGTDIGADGDLLVMWDPESSAAVVFDLTFGIPIHVTTFSRGGKGPANFGRIQAVGVDASRQEIFFLDRGLGRISKWRLARDRDAPLKMDPFMGRFVRSWNEDLLAKRVAAKGGGGSLDLRDLVIRDGVLNLLDAAGPSIITTDDRLQVSSVHRLPKGTMPVQIAVRPGGGWLVSEPEAGRVLVLDATGKVERTIIGAAINVVRPFGVAELADGRIAVSDRNSDVFVVVDRDGEVLARGGEQGSWDGALWMPAALEFLPDGGLVVLDQGNHRAQVFDPETGGWRISFSLGQGHDRPLLLRSDFEPATDDASIAETEVGK
ncbi:MAG: hypothetical protein O3A19_01285 [Planctomycetota bacterium]|nr:hypothetical protein [Planctomycetota bacterium]MDA1025038.1 hypothetical protein [Planctomycetota bacterium]